MSPPYPIVSRVLVGMAASYLLFVLPYSFPPRTRLVSPSYVFGFNNQVAILAFIGLILLLSFAYFWSRSTPASDILNHMRGVTGFPNRALILLYLGLALWYLALTLAIYFLVAKPDGYYKLDWESSYFLWRVKLMNFYGLHPYRDFEMAYGPALAYLPAWISVVLRPLGISPEAAYYILHYLLNLSGLAALAYVVDSLSMPVRLKCTAFLLVGLSAFSPPMGLSGLLIRYLLPYASQLLVYRAALNATGQKTAWRLSIIIGATSIANLALSPEIGIAWLAGLSVFAALLLRREPSTAIQIFLSEAAVIAISALVLPTAYFLSLLRFSQGADNLPVLPALHIVFYVAVVLLCVPRLLATGLLERNLQASCVCALGALSLALLPAALGRCDPPHVVLNGYGLFTVAFALFAQSGPRRVLVYSAAYAMVAIVAFQYSNARVYGISPSRLRSGMSRIHAGLERLMRKPRSNSGPPPAGSTTNPEPPRAAYGQSYAGFDKYPFLGLPYGSYGYEKSLQRYLWSTRKIVPERYMAVVNVYDEDHMTKRFAELSRIRYILIQKDFRKLYEHRDTCKELQDYVKSSFLYFSAPACLHDVLDPNLEMAKFIDQHYHLIDQIGDYLVLEWNAHPLKAGKMKHAFECPGPARG